MSAETEYAPSALSTAGGIPTSTSTDVSNTSIEWGPAITAGVPAMTASSDASLPTSQTTGTIPSSTAAAESGPSEGISPDSRIILIVTTIVGGTIILGLLFYAMWRRERVASTPKSVLASHPPAMTSTKTALGGPPRPADEESQIAALPVYSPVYSEKRISGSSSFYGSVTDFPTAQQGVPYIPSPFRDSVGTSIPPQPFVLRSALPSPTASTPVSNLSREHLPKTALRLTRDLAPSQLRLKETTRKTPGLTIAVQEPSPRDEHFPPPGPDGVESPHRQSGAWNRWSWTNSEAPTTPRLVAKRATPPPMSAQQSSVTSWIRAQGSRAEDVAEEPHPSADSARPAARDSAAKPVLEARPVVELRRGESWRSILRPGWEALVPAPLSPRHLVEERRWRDG